MRPGIIAVIDDDDDLRDAIGEILRDAGYGVLTFAGASEALSEIR
jgi:FixJ family two-component response regulator